MPRKPKAQRTAEQRVRQKEVRDNAREARRPSRDDVARMFLWQTIVTTLKRKDAKVVLEKLRYEIVDALEHQGFNQGQSLDVFDDLVKRYSDGLYPFRRKVHLNADE